MNTRRGSPSDHFCQFVFNIDHWILVEVHPSVISAIVFSILTTCFRDVKNFLTKVHKGNLPHTLATMAFECSNSFGYFCRKAYNDFFHQIIVNSHCPFQKVTPLASMVFDGLNFKPNKFREL